VLAARAGDDLDQAIEGLRASRPTAVNLSWALNRMQSVRSNGWVDVHQLERLAAAIEAEDRALTQALVNHGVGFCRRIVVFFITVIPVPLPRLESARPLV